MSEDKKWIKEYNSCFFSDKEVLREIVCPLCNGDFIIDISREREDILKKYLIQFLKDLKEIQCEVHESCEFYSKDIDPYIEKWEKKKEEDKK